MHASNFVAGYYITQIQDRKIKPLVYDSIILLLAKQNYNAYRYKLITIVKFIKKYLYMLNTERLFTQMIMPTSDFLMPSTMKTSLHAKQINYTYLISTSSISQGKKR